MATRKQINEEYGIATLMTDDIANAELAKDDEEMYRNIVQYISQKGREAKKTEEKTCI